MSRIWRWADQSQRMRKRNDIGLAPELAGSCDLSQNSIRNESSYIRLYRQKEGGEIQGFYLEGLSSLVVRLASGLGGEARRSVGLPLASAADRMLFRTRLSTLVQSRCLCHLLYSQVLVGKGCVWRWYNQFLLYRYASARADRETERKNK